MSETRAKSEQPSAKNAADGASESGEEALRQARIEKAEKVRARGENPFANDVAVQRDFLRDIRVLFDSATFVDEADGQTKYDEAKVAELGKGPDGQPRKWLVAGRMVARRGFGKASFLRVRDGSDEMQVFAKKDELGDDFAHLKDVDLADHIEARGIAMVTKTGELSVQAESFRLITKALRPPADKWHGLTDVDIRYRRRYVDMVANPEVADVIAARAHVLKGLRRYLDDRAFVEVETPSLHSIIGGAAARPFETHHNALDMDLFLRIAPELYLKRLLVGGLERVYEIGRSYRNEGISTRHNPEFTMIELYWAYANYETLMAMTEEMMRFVDAQLAKTMAQRGKTKLYEKWKAERPFTLDEPFRRVPLTQAIDIALEAAFAGSDVTPGDVTSQLEALGVVEETPASAKATGDALVQKWSAVAKGNGRDIDWANLRRALGVCGTPGDRVFVAYEYLAEAFLTQEPANRVGEKSIPVFIIDYPAEVSPLARRKDSDPTLVDRFELFVDGREICNAFNELNDPEDQASRFKDQVERKSRGQDETMDYDEDYIRALEHGMPPAAGFGMGIDRFLMMLTSQPSIRDVIAFPLLRPEGR